jgi:hypothetical protein
MVEGMIKPMARIVWVLVFLLQGLAAGEEEGEWHELFDGKTLNGWKAVSGANWRVEEGAIVVDDGPQGLLIHEDTYGDYELSVEFKAAKGANSGVFLNTADRPKDVKVDCYELNIAPPENPFPTGSIVGRKKAEGAGETDGWRKFEVRMEKGHLTVKLDGKVVIDDSFEPAPKEKGLGLQKNSGRVAFRNIRVRKLD